MISPQKSLKEVEAEILMNMPKLNHAPYVVAYNPSNWHYKVYFLLHNEEEVSEELGILYQILHISQ